VTSPSAWKADLPCAIRHHLVATSCQLVSFSPAHKLAACGYDAAARQEYLMARCEQGYLCDVCGKDVEAITESDLYLRYVMGEVSPLELPTQSERHIRCHPAAAQYIVDPAFDPPVRCEGVFAKENLDVDHVRQEQARVTRAWRRLQQLPALGLPITEYPLPEVLQKWAAQDPQGSKARPGA
jgi:hypothetical protein